MMSAPRTQNRWLNDYAALGLVILSLTLFFSWRTDSFFSSRTLTAVINQIPALTLVSVGMTFVMISGGIDLSVGSVLALSGAVSGVLLEQWGWSIWLSVPIGLTVGLFCGIACGSISVLAAIPSFIVSLGVMQVARGLTYACTSSTSVYVSRASGVQWLGARIEGWGISPAFALSAAVVIASQLALHRTVFGRYLLAIGNNETVAQYSGINTYRIRILAFALCGLLAALAGVVEVSRLSAVDPNAGFSFELSAIAATVIGGTSLKGGQGSMINTFLGVLVIAVLQTGLIQIGASEGAKYITTGCVIVVAVLVDAIRRRKSQIMLPHHAD